jgi:hypothetical protein
MRRRYQAAGLARPDERLPGASSELGSTRQRADHDVQQSNPASFPRKWPWKSGNGGFPGLFAFSARRLEMISSSPMEIKECAISNVQLVHPLRGTACAGRRRPVQAVGRSRWLRPKLFRPCWREHVTALRVARAADRRLRPPLASPAGHDRRAARGAWHWITDGPWRS